ncbi:hypothetical protein BGZ46_009126, partial [Entomortierella lignicola]
FVPMLAPTQAPTSAPVASFQPAFEIPAMGHPASTHSVAPSALPIIATWQKPSDDMLTYTSYAGLLNTIAPAFYPSILPVTESLPETKSVPQPAIATPLYTPTPAISMTFKPQSTLSPAKPEVRYTSSNILPTPTLMPTKTTDQVTSTTHEVTRPLIKSSMTGIEHSSTLSDQVSRTSADTTVSSTTTTRGYTTHITTSVGSDGITTVMTEYPLSTHGAHDSQSTSGAQKQLSRNQAPFGYVFNLLLFGVGFCLIDMTTVGIMILSVITMV